MSFWAILGIVVAPLAVATLIGLRLPKTHVAASRICLNASPEEVWAVLVDYPGHPKWRSGLDAVELGPEVDGHPTWYEVCGPNIRVQFARIECIRPTRITTRLVGKKLPLSGTWTYEITPTQDGSQVTITQSEFIYNPLIRFFSQYVISYYGAMDVFLDALARKFGETAQPEHLTLKLGVQG